MRIALASLLCVLAGCGAEAPSDRFDTYAVRLGRVLDEAAADGDEPRRPAMPRPRELVLRQTQGSIDLLDFLSLQDCALQEVVARRNNALGKVARASTRLVFELDFLRLAPACLAVLPGEEEAGLIAAIERALAAKRDSLPATIWQAVLGAREYRDFWRPPLGLSDYPASAHLPVDAALVGLTALVDRWLGGDYAVDAAMLEGLLVRISAGDGGDLLTALELQARQLGRLDDLIALRLDDRPLCPVPGTDAAEPLRAVVGRFFIDQIQPWSARLNARRLQLLPLVQALEARLAQGEPAVFREWRMRRDVLLTRWSEAPKAHVGRLLPLMEQCGVAPVVDGQG